MKNKILLLDSGVTVQKIVALSLDKENVTTFFATTKEEGKRIILSEKPDLVLVSDRLNGLEWSSFPKEVETWVGLSGSVPRMVLLASGQVETAKHYFDVLNKPFTPQHLQELVKKIFAAGATVSAKNPAINTAQLNSLFGDSEDEVVTSSQILSLEKDEEEVSEIQPAQSSGPSTRNQLEELWSSGQEVESGPDKEASPRVESISDLWGVPAPEAQSMRKNPEFEPEADLAPVLSTEESVAYKSLLENQVQQKLEAHNLTEMVEKVLARLLPPMVERLVQERLDQLMAEQEQEGASSLHL